MIELILALAAFQGAVPPVNQGAVPPVNQGPVPPAAAAPDPEAGAEAAAPAVAPVPYPGRYVEGMHELRELAQAGRVEQAVAVADALLAPGRVERWRSSLERATGGRSEAWLTPLRGPLGWIGLETLDARDRAQVHYAKGLAQGRAGQVSEAEEAFETARVLAGPGETRLDAIYALGTLDLALGETLRERIPEIAEKLGLPPPQPLPSAGPAGPAGTGSEPEPPPDPLDLARACYTRAREHLIERLRSDWRDDDARANVELCVRRLRELDELEREREEQQQEQQDQDQQDPQDQDQEGGESEDQEPSDEEQQDEEGEDDSEQDEPQPEEPEEPQDGSEEDEPQEPEQAPAEEEERVLTQEEVKRLLQRLAELEEKGEEIRARLQGTRREPVEKDW